MGSRARIALGPEPTTSSACNIVRKLFNREIYSSTSRNKHNRNEKIFERIPPRLRFCLLDIVPKSYIHSHVFMGFSQCGQFLLSYVSERTFNRMRSDYREGMTFRLHFLSWVPGRIAHSVHSVPLFDDDGVENKVSVSMTQWKHNPSILVVYGIAEVSTERSYLSIIGVPQLGCKKCISFSDGEEDLNCWGKRCLEHNFAIHTKFYCASDSSMFEPVVQLAYSNQIIIYTDYIHILEVDYVKPEPNEPAAEDNTSYIDQTPNINSLDTNPSTPSSEISAPCPSPRCHSTVVQNILADFAELEMETCPTARPIQLSDMIGQELCIQASSISQNLVEEWEGPSPSIRTLISPPLRSPRRRPAEGMSRFNEMHRSIAEKTYEFVEETEPKCEKLSIFRKRRLADKKYEFSEDNNENIVPFRVLRSNRKYFIGNTSKGLPRRAKSPPVESVVFRVHNQINPPSTSTAETAEPKSPRLASLHPDNSSEPEYRVTAMADDGSMKTISVHDNTSKTLSDCVVHPQDPYLVHSDNSKCTKYFTRLFVESDDDITSIITDSEDDCLSGYHVALPLTAHGAGYAPLQAISLGAWERLRSAGESKLPLPSLTLRTQQRSLDIELLCNEVCIRLCRLNDKKFIYCFDWGCHVIDVCQSSGCLCGLQKWDVSPVLGVRHRRIYLDGVRLCAMWLWASEEGGAEGGAEAASDCYTCKEDRGSGCLLHRRQYAAECLFVWDLVSGIYRTEHVSMKEDDTQEVNRVSGADRARELAMKLVPLSTPPSNENRILTTLTGRSLRKLMDADHCIEITKNHPDSSESESEPEPEPEDSDSDAYQYEV